MSGEAWVEWKGGECPIAGDVLVDVRFRDTGEQGAVEAWYWADPNDGRNCWKHNGENSDIIAYRVTRP